MDSRRFFDLIIGTVIDCEEQHRHNSQIQLELNYKEETSIKKRI